MENEINNNESEQREHSYDKIEEKFFEQLKEFHRLVGDLTKTAKSLALAHSKRYSEIENSLRESFFVLKTRIDASDKLCKEGVRYMIWNSRYVSLEHINTIMYILLEPRKDLEYLLKENFKAW